MFKKAEKGNEVHEMIMEQFKNIKKTMYSFEEFINVSYTKRGDSDTLRSLCDTVYDNESAADYALRRMIESLSGSPFLPQTREELISIASSCDKIANRCEDVAYNMILQGFLFPEDFHEDLKEIIAVTHQEFKLLEESISMLFSNFKDFLKNHSILDDIRELESKVDRIERKLLKKTYGYNLDAAQTAQMAGFIQATCDISDVIEDIADKIQVMLVTRKA